MPHLAPEPLPDLENDEEFDAFCKRVAAYQVIAVAARHEELRAAIEYLESLAVTPDAPPEYSRILGVVQKMERAQKR